jgi:type IV pilus assembly protein PilE
VGLKYKEIFFLTLSSQRSCQVFPAQSPLGGSAVPSSILPMGFPKREGTNCVVPSYGIILNKTKRRHMKYTRTAGFTLIELVIALVVVAILASIAFPSYQESIRKGRRTDAKVALTDLANRLERYYSDKNTYATATIAGVDPTKNVLSSADSPEGHYTLSITAQDATSFTIKAARKTGGLQVSDAKCGDFTLTSAGIKGITGGTGSAADCW